MKAASEIAANALARAILAGPYTGIDVAGGPDITVLSMLCAGRHVALGAVPRGCVIHDIVGHAGEVLIATDQGVFVSRAGVLVKLQPICGI